MRHPDHPPIRPALIQRQALADARLIVTSPDVAVLVPTSLRYLAWAALKSARGQTTRQRPVCGQPATGGAA
ncbi:hypothetical protein ACEYYA_00790 [Paracoccus sp. p3-h83]|uniref:hypothetical protein n=1 Tax=Paracoccus sp. p3-h83 TaxID=3342805 RepID=UPI0035B74D19